MYVSTQYRVVERSKSKLLLATLTTSNKDPSFLIALFLSLKKNHRESRLDLQIFIMSQSTDNNHPNKTIIPPKPEPAERNESVDSAAFFESGDDYDDYGDFGVNQATGGGGGGGVTTQKIDKRQEHRGGSGGSGSIYSVKHVRAKEAQKGK
jgi:hypothetical protein